MRLTRGTATLIVLLGLAAPASAYNPKWPNQNASPSDLLLPENWPDNNGYGYEFPGTCPGSTTSVMRPQDGYWELWSFFPPDTPDPCNQNAPWQLGEKLGAQERSVMRGTGMSADIAWTVTTGDPRVLIAIHDSGINWGDGELNNKMYLNEGELTPPQTASGTPCTPPAGITDPFDCNGDGVFNVLDYTSFSPAAYKSGTGDDVSRMSIVVDPRILNYQCPGNPTCHGDTNGNGILDPQDLIRIFADGKDNDGNGFIDDISGWDFFTNSNDPEDPQDALGYSHGTGEAEGAAAEANNGQGGPGVCPDCRVMMVRVADSFIGDGSHFGEGVYYSLSQGASVISEALGTLDTSAITQEAINAAYAQGAIVIASAADEDSLHHNAPGNAEHTLMVHTVMYDQPAPEASTSFINFANCSNAGEHLALSTPGSACSSEATELSAGEAGLIYSAMRQYQGSQPPLTAAEAMQLMWTSAEDISVPGSATNPALWPSGTGWDLYFGYGRNDAGAAVTAVKNGQIPPEIDITSPHWFETFDPAATPKLTITGRVAASRAPTYDFQVFAGPGVSPQQTNQLTQVASLTGLSSVTSGTLATVDLKGLVPNDTAAPTLNCQPGYCEWNVEQNAVTIVVMAVAHYGGTIGDVPGMFRKVINVHQDPDLFSGFPINLGTSGFVDSGESSPHLVDLDGSGHDTIVVASSDGQVHAIQANGQELRGWPVRVGALTDVAALPNVPGYMSLPAADKAQPIDASVAVGSLHGDGKMQVVASTLDGQVYAWNADGSIVPGFPVSADPAHFQPPCAGTTTFQSLAGSSDPINQVTSCTDADGTVETYALGKGFFASPALYDLDKDGTLEIIQPGQDGWLYVWDASGNPFPGFPVDVYDPRGQVNGSVVTLKHTRLMTTPAVGDILGDGFGDIVIGSNETYSNGVRLHAIHHDGNNHAGGPFLTGWPLAIGGAVSDLLPMVGDGEPNPAALGDVNGDGILDVGFAPLSGSPLFYTGAAKFLGSGEESDVGAKATVHDNFGYAAAVNNGTFADVDGDGKLEFVNGAIGGEFGINGISGAQRVNPSHSVVAWSTQLAYEQTGVGFTAPPLEGFPAATADYQFFMNYVVADIDGDGKNEIISGCGVSLVTAFRADGSQPANWPKNTGGWVAATPALGDIDGDGYIDIVTTTREGFLWAWHGHGKANQKIEWESYHHDAQNTGNYTTKLPVRAGPKKAGCTCTASDASELLSLMAALAAVSRRRRARAP